ncbi:PREDICTED: gibberellin-regulated protein 14 isoform X1 [Lupinus angustifolius]|uniref:gibberellin-regulated protein 14 isoform X1 n=1 Tax=Lupinus angustifolius TaxID=3871 RepID=UPI00092E37D7|nr:PREDICTED: gibberellin-regulated protein 14 isoform X1 [Lupinus angustifolius]
MAFKSFILLLISLLVLTTKVSSYDEVLNIVPILRPIPSTPIKAPTTPSPPPVKAPPPSPPPVKAPPTTPPPVKTPSTPPPVKTPSTPPPSPPPVNAPPPVKPPTPPPSPPPTTPSSPAQPPVAPAPIVKSDKDCIPLCGYRCQLHSRKQICVRACVTCCDRCKCVPPGTYGNRDKCGKCYTDMLTHGNRPKCP